MKILIIMVCFQLVSLVVKNNIINICHVCIPSIFTLQYFYRTFVKVLYITQITLQLKLKVSEKLEMLLKQSLKLLPRLVQIFKFLDLVGTTRRVGTLSGLFPSSRSTRSGNLSCWEGILVKKWPKFKRRSM